MCLPFGFVIFWQKDFGTKAASKMLVKLTPGPTCQAPGVLQYDGQGRKRAHLLQRVAQLRPHAHRPKGDLPCSPWDSKLKLCTAFIN